MDKIEYKDFLPDLANPAPQSITRAQHSMLVTLLGSSPGWRDALSPEFEKPYFAELMHRVAEDEAGGAFIFPPACELFNAFRETSLERVKVVIIGQDPYPTRGHAHGLAFSVKEGVKPPKSLINIFKELYSDILLDSTAPTPTSGSLLPWAREGVLLLNTHLTVKEGEPMSHAGYGWDIFTQKAIEAAAKRQSPSVFILWGKQAQRLEGLIKNPAHLIIKSPHPSPLSAYRGFFGSRPFSRTNKFLSQNGVEPVDWLGGLRSI